MRILALDQSTSCTGYSIFSLESGFIKSGFFIPTGKDSDEKIYSVVNFIKKTVEEYNIKLGCLEGVWLAEGRNKGFGDNVQTLIKLGRLLGACETAFRDSKVIRVTTYAPSSWKSYYKLLRKPNQKQLAVGLAKKYKSDLVSEDEAESILIGNYYRSELLTIYEKDMKNGEFKVKNNLGKVYPHIFVYWQKKHFNELSRSLDIKISKEVKEVIGTSMNGKNKWGKFRKEFYIDELGSLNKELKLEFMNMLKQKSKMESELSVLVYEAQLKYIEIGE
ncbi:MAG: hypothetical protein ACRC0Y_09010 [Fusobacteriaceae bacterium]